LLVKRLLKT